MADKYSEPHERPAPSRATETVPDEIKGDLAALRKLQGLTQAGLAKAADIPLRAIQKYESGECAIKNMTLDKAIRLADALGVEPRDLLLL